MTRNKKIAIAGGLILIIGILFGIYQCFFSAPKEEFELERYVVPLGADATRDTQEAIIHNLREKGFVRSEWAFKLVLKIRDLEGEIKPGGYKISKSWNAWKLALALANFRYQKWVVIPEGLRKEEIAEIIGEELRWTEEIEKEFIANSKEGYLFPDTYLLNFDHTGEEVTERMENQFNEKAAELFKEAAEKNIRNDTLVVLASLVQREAADEEEMSIIAGVIWNRWLNDIKFEIDATVQYALGEPGDWWPKIKPEDYKTDSSYNTYLHKGRPPTPICNPGLAAINAVINSEDSEYLYYLHDSERQIHLAKTYEEHLENIREYFWNNYKDEKLGYEMKYPSTWSIAEETKDSSAVLSRTIFWSKDYQEIESEEYKERVDMGEETGLLQPTIMSGGMSLEFLITEIPSDFEWRDWAERATDYPYGEIVSENILTLRGKEAYERQVKFGEITSIVISFPNPKETILFEFILNTLKRNEDKNLEILKQILSTFKFLN